MTADEADRPTPDSAFFDVASQLLLDESDDPRMAVGNLVLVEGRNGERAVYPVDDPSGRPMDILVAERWGAVRNLAWALIQLNQEATDETEPADEMYH